MIAAEPSQTTKISAKSTYPAEHPQTPSPQRRRTGFTDAALTSRFSEDKSSAGSPRTPVKAQQPSTTYARFTIKEVAPQLPPIVTGSRITDFDNAISDSPLSKYEDTGFDKTPSSDRRPGPITFSNGTTPAEIQRAKRAERKARIGARSSPKKVVCPDDSRTGLLGDLGMGYLEDTIIASNRGRSHTGPSLMPSLKSAKTALALTQNVSFESGKGLKSEQSLGSISALTMPLLDMDSSGIPTPKRSKTEFISDRIKFFESASRRGTDRVVDKVKSSTQRLKSRVSKAMNSSQQDLTSGDGPSFYLARLTPELSYKPYATHVLGPGQKVGRRGNIVGTWNFNPLPEDYERSFPRPPPIVAKDKNKDMVIKEADCGLREPRPVRMSEMKRMTALCMDKVEKVGGFVRGEKRKSKG